MSRTSSNWRNQRRKFTEERKLQIIAGLLRLRQEHVFAGIWVDGNTLAVQWTANLPREHMSWSEAAKLVEPAEKPMGKAVKLGAVQSQEAPKGVGTRKRAESA